MAEQLNFYAEATETLRSQPFATATWPAERDHGWMWSRSLDDFTVNFPSLSVRFAATRSVHRLAQTALELRRAALTTGTYPELTDNTPSEFTGKPIRRRNQPDGSVVLDLEGAQELWEKHVQPTPARPSLMPSEWHLPAVNGPAKRPAA